MAINTGAILLLALVATAYGNVALSDFFPFGPTAGDARVPTADDNFVNVSVNTGNVFHFFRNSYTEFFLNNNGGVSFRRGAPEFTPTCGPLDTPMIMPYWADVNTVLGGNVYYRQTTDSAMIQKARDECRRAFPGLNTQNINWMFLATWENVPFFGAQAANGSCSGLNARNNFQLALVTDGTLSFAMFFYNNITWTTGTASGGDCNGMNGTPAKAGFDVGDGVNFFTLPGTCTSEILAVTGTSNVEQNGKWIFRIDDSFVDPGVPETTTFVPEETTTFVPEETTTFVPEITTFVPETTTTEAPIEGGSVCDPDLCELVGHCTSYFTCDPRSRRRVAWECSEGLFWNPKKPKRILALEEPTTWAPVEASTISGDWQTSSAPSGTWAPSPSAPSATWAPAPAGPSNSSNGWWTPNGTYYVPPVGSAAAGRQLYPYPGVSPSSPGSIAPGYPPSEAYTASPVESSTAVPEEECHGSCDVWENLPSDVKASYEADSSCFPKCYYAALGECLPYYLFHAHNKERRDVELLECPVDTRNGMHVPLVWVQERESCDFCYNVHVNSASFLPMPSGRSLIGSTKQWDTNYGTSAPAMWDMNGTYYGTSAPPTAPYYNYNNGNYFGNQTTCCTKYDSLLLPEAISIPVISAGRLLKGEKGKVVHLPQGDVHNFDLKHKG